VLLGLLIAYYALREPLPNLPPSADVAFLALVLMPLVFALVYLALPLREWRGLLPVGVALVALAVFCSKADLEVMANFAKFGAAVAIAFWFLSYFEAATWLLLVALIIPVVDAYSVFRGPTRHIVSERPEVFSALAFSFPEAGERAVFLRWRPPLEGSVRGYDVYRSETLPVLRDEPINSGVIEPDEDDERVTVLDLDLSMHEDYHFVIEALHRGGERVATRPVRSTWPEDDVQRAPPSRPDAPQDVSAEAVASSAKLGLPDVLFFSLFLAAAARFGLRVPWTWLAGVLSFGVTMTLAIGFDVSGLPALPLLSLAFVLPNADLLWRDVRKSLPRRR
jgi:hypothetical protein